jgi:hypothetical protein
MKNLLCFLVILLPLSLFAQDDGYFQLETIILTPMPGHAKELSDNMAAHNKTYHAEVPYTAQVFGISSGPNIGKLVWMMGPCTFTDLDKRPGEGGHDEDWANNVMPHVKGISHGEYWRRDGEMVIDNRADQTVTMPMYMIRYSTVAPGQSYRVNGLMEKVHATLAAIDDVDYWAFYRNIFLQGNENGRHVATVSGLNSWSEFDESLGFSKKFDEIHGEGAHEKFRKEINEVFSNTWHEIWSLNKKMSGMED